MALPPENSAVTQDQINAAINIGNFPGSTPGSNWHYGQFEPWALQFGYENGMPLYGSVIFNGASVHMYWLNDGHQQPIIMTNGQTPATYGVEPT